MLSFLKKIVISISSGGAVQAIQLQAWWISIYHAIRKAPAR